MVKYSSFIVPVLILYMMGSCSSNPTHKSLEMDTGDSAATVIQSPAFPDLSDRTNLTFPFVINNDNYFNQYDAIKGAGLTPSEFAAMRLDSLYDCSISDGCNFYVLHGVAFSRDFKTWLIYRVNEGSEWKMWLVNYTPGNQFIDHLCILYGDSVEYMHETISYVSQNEIEVTAIIYDYSGETQKSTKEVVRYAFDQSGHFIKTRFSEN